MREEIQGTVGREAEGWGNPHCAYCKAGIDRTAESGGRTFIHILTRGAHGQMLKWRPCPSAAE